MKFATFKDMLLKHLDYEFREGITPKQQSDWLHDRYQEYERSYYGKVPMDEQISVVGWMLDMVNDKTITETLFSEKK